MQIHSDIHIQEVQTQTLKKKQSQEKLPGLLRNPISPIRSLHESRLQSCKNSREELQFQLYTILRRNLHNAP